MTLRIPAIPHPDKGGEPAPLLALPPARDRATVTTLHTLTELLVHVERRLAAGPWDSWDGDVLAAWRDTVRAKIAAAEQDLRDQLSPCDYEIVSDL